MLSKDYKINYPIGDDIAFDDFSQIYKIDKNAYKVSKVKVAKDSSSNYITGLQFTYKNIYTPLTEITGTLMGKRDVFTDKQNKNIEFILQQDEFIIELKGRNGLIIDNFGFVTSINKSYSFGGVGGNPFSVKAPVGFHFVNFGALFSQSWKNISSFSADILRIPQKQNQFFQGQMIQKFPNSLTNLLCQLPVFRSLIEFLSIHDITRLFAVSKHVSNMRFDSFVIGQLSLRCVFSGDPNLVEYMSSLRRNCPRVQEFERMDYYLCMCKNIVDNPSGELQKEKLDIDSSQVTVEIQNNRTHFKIPNHGQTTFKWTCDMRKHFSEKELAQLTQGTLAIVAGMQFAESGYGTNVTLTLEISFKDGKRIQVTNKLEKLTRDMLAYNIVYNLKTEESVFPTTAKLYITIFEPSWWPSRLRYINFRKFPFSQTYEKALLLRLGKGQKYCQIDQDKPAN